VPKSIGAKGNFDWHSMTSYYSSIVTLDLAGTIVVNIVGY